MKKLFFTLLTLFSCTGIFADEWSIDFGTIANNNNITTDKTGVTISTNEDDVITFNKTTFGTATLGEELNRNFRIQTGTSWLYRTEKKGIYSANSGTRSFCVCNATADQVITVVSSVQPTATNATLTSENSTTLTYEYKVTADGTVAFAIPRYNTVYSISVADPDLSSVNYTVKYVDADGNEIKTSTSGSGQPGAAITIGSIEKASFTVDGKKYVYDSDDSSDKTIGADGNTVVTVKFREAGSYSYTINSSLNTTLATGTCFEGDAVTIAYPKYINVDGTLYTKNATNKEYNYTFTPANDKYSETLEYTATDITDVVYYEEAEDIDVLTKTTSSPINVRCSGSAGGYTAESVTLTTLAPGKYKLMTAIAGNSGATYSFMAGENEIGSISTTGSWTATTTDEFELSAETEITVSGTGTSSSKALDYVCFIKTGEYEAPVADLTATKEYKVNGSLTFAYDATASREVYEFGGFYNGTVYGTPTTTIVAGKPYIVTAGDDLTLTYKSDATEATYGSDYNGFHGVLGSSITAYGSDFMAFYNGNIYYANDGGTTIAPGRAYFQLNQVPGGAPASEAKALFSFSMDEVTGINAINAAQNANAPVYNIAGQSVNNAQKGIFIVNGKKIAK